MQCGKRVFIAVWQGYLKYSRIVSNSHFFSGAVADQLEMFVMKYICKFLKMSLHSHLGQNDLKSKCPWFYKKSYLLATPIRSFKTLISQNNLKARVPEEILN